MTNSNLKIIVETVILRKIISWFATIAKFIMSSFLFWFLEFWNFLTPVS